MELSKWEASNTFIPPLAGNDGHCEPLAAFVTRSWSIEPLRQTGRNKKECPITICVDGARRLLVRSHSLGPRIVDTSGAQSFAVLASVASSMKFRAELLRHAMTVMLCHGRGRGFEAATCWGRNLILGTEFIVWVGLRQTSMKTEKTMGSTLVFSTHCIAQAALTQKMGIPWAPVFVEIGSPEENP
jgi:hypothetical protein